MRNQWKWCACVPARIYVNVRVYILCHFCIHFIVGPIIMFMFISISMGTLHGHAALTCSMGLLACNVGMGIGMQDGHGYTT